MSDHPDLEALSAELDGVGEPASAAHLASCPACRARLEELASVRAAIAAPVAPAAADVRERGLAAALAAAGDTGETAGGTAGTQPGVVPLERRRSRTGVRWWVPGSAAAAVLAIVVLSVALIGGGLGGGGTDETDTALSAGGAGQSALESAPPPGDQAVDAGDLGDVRDLATLRSRVAAAVAPVAPMTGEAPTAARNAAPGAASDAAAPQPRVVGTRVCEVEARTARPQLGVVVYAATLRYQGTPAVVLGFATGIPGASPVTLLVLAPGESCRVLAESTTP